MIRWLLRALAALALLILVLLSPVAWTEIACHGSGRPDSYRPILTSPEERRAETRTLLTYPEWHIVHAYDDYAVVILIGDPHDFAYFRAIAGFWSALCPLTRAADGMGEVTGETRLTVYTIGVSFTAELALKAFYEETLGRLAVLIRGEERAPLDDLSAGQAAEYAAFLQQTPWYRWDFRAAADALVAAATETFCDRERQAALGIEYGGKALYAGLIEGAVGQVGADRLAIRSIVTGLAPAEIAAVPDVTVIGTRAEGVEIETPRYRRFTRILAALAERGANVVEIETPRYRRFTRILAALAERGADVVEIAGNDDILLTAPSPAPGPGALYSFPRQGYGDVRNLMLVKVGDLARTLRGIAPGKVTLEHIHDY